MKATIAALTLLAVMVLLIEGKPLSIKEKGRGVQRRLEKLKEKLISKQCEQVCPPMPGNSTSNLECARCIVTGSLQLSDFLSAVALARSDKNCSSRMKVTNLSESKRSASEQSENDSTESDSTDESSSSSSSEESESTAESDSESEVSESDSTSDASTAVEKRLAEEEDDDNLVNTFAALIGDCHGKCGNLSRGCGKPVLPCLKCIIKESDMDETM